MFLLYHNKIKITSEIGKKMHDNGVQFAYHNHAFEFAKLDNGRRIFDMLIEDTKPEEFSFIGDTYWFQFGGVNPCDYIEKIAKMHTSTHKVKFSINPVVPKPHTPLQWTSYNFKDVKRKSKYITKKLYDI